MKEDNHRWPPIDPAALGPQAPARLHRDAPGYTAGGVPQGEAIKETELPNS